MGLKLCTSWHEPAWSHPCGLSRSTASSSSVDDPPLSTQASAPAANAGAGLARLHNQHEHVHLMPTALDFPRGLYAAHVG